MTTIADVREKYYEHSKKASDVSRQLALAGIAVVWLFKTSIAGVAIGAYGLPSALFWPTLLMLVSLALDLLQYVWQAALWGTVSRSQEKQHGTDTVEWDGIRPAWNLPANVLFWGKLVSMLVGYGLLLVFLFRHVAFN
ncbi:hypothetical protein [Paraburkholderia sediminicola]|uniref:hypothetical protein n=1 Tax=Paraburkholderia sediminicola TaxID=458836 RepID=UPI0038BE0A1D